MGILSEGLDKINIDDVDFDKDNPENIIHVRFMAWRNRFKQCQPRINAFSMAFNKMVG